jgi:hypothetical protein
MRFKSIRYCVAIHCSTYGIYNVDVKHSVVTRAIGPVMPGSSILARMQAVSSLSVLKCPPAALL